MTNTRFVIKLDGKLWKETLYKSSSKALSIISEWKSNTPLHLKMLEEDLQQLLDGKHDHYSSEEREKFINRYRYLITVVKERLAVLLPELDRLEVVEVNF